MVSLSYISLINRTECNGMDEQSKNSRSNETRTMYIITITSCGHSYIKNPACILYLVV